MPYDVADLNYLKDMTYLTPEIMMDPEIQQKIKKISSDLFQLKAERIHELAPPIRTAVVTYAIDSALKRDDQSALQGLKPYLNDEIFSQLLSNPTEMYKEIIQIYCKNASSVSLHGNLTQAEIHERLERIPLETRNSIKHLDLSACSFLVDLAPLLPLFPQLTQLNLSRTKLKNLNGIESLKFLTTLNISECRSLTTLQGIEGHKNLRTLVANNCSYLSNLEAISECAEMEELDLSLCSLIKSLKPIYSLEKLKKLSLMGLVNLKTVHAFKSLFNLQELHLEGSGVTDISPLSTLKHLSQESIHVKGCRIKQDLKGAVSTTT